MNLILQALKSLFRKVERTIDDLKSNLPKSDWNQNDPESDGSILNRTHYHKKPVLTDHLLEERSITGFVDFADEAWTNSNRTVYGYNIDDYIYAEHDVLANPDQTAKEEPVY